MPIVISVTIFAWACGGSGTSGGYGEDEAVEIKDSAVTVQLKNILFEPRAINVKPGTTVTWVNDDTVIHNVTSINNVFRSEDEMQQGDEFSFRFDSPGNFRYQCTFHPPNMIGVVMVEE